MSNFQDQENIDTIFSKYPDIDIDIDRIFA